MRTRTQSNVAERESSPWIQTRTTAPFDLSQGIVEGHAILFRVGSRPSSPNPLAALAEPKIAPTGVASRSSMKVWWGRVFKIGSG